jgi:hypothetical protein
MSTVRVTPTSVVARAGDATGIENKAIAIVVLTGSLLSCSDLKITYRLSSGDMQEKDETTPS